MPKSFDKDGNVVVISDPIFNNLDDTELIPDLPGDDFWVPVVVRTPDGKHRRLVLASSDVMKAPRVALAAQVTDLANLASMYQAQQTALSNIVTQLAAKKTPILLPNVIIPAASLVSLSATAKTILGLTCSGLKTTDTLVITSTNWPVGYGLRSFSIPSNDTLSVVLQVPILSVGGAPITLNIQAYR